MLAWTYFAGSCSSCAALEKTPMTKLPLSSESAAAPSSEHIARRSIHSTSPSYEVHRTAVSVLPGRC